MYLHMVAIPQAPWAVWGTGPFHLTQSLNLFCPISLPLSRGPLHCKMLAQPYDPEKTGGLSFGILFW